MTYQEEGYKVGGRICEEAINGILSNLEKFKKAKRIYYSQATHRYKRAEVDSCGYLTESIEGVSRMKGERGLGESVESVLCSEEVKALPQEIIPSERGYVMHQSMLFDKSMQTIDHIDSWYLDTEPKEDLLAFGLH